MKVFFAFVYLFVFISISNANNLSELVKTIKIEGVQNLNEEDFPLFPTDDTIPDFPEVIDVAETNTKVLEDYYLSIAEAYEKWAEENNTKMQKASVYHHSSRSSLDMMKIAGSCKKSNKTDRCNKMMSDQHFKNARLSESQMRYHQEIAERSMQKAKFYNHLSDRIKEIDSKS